MEHRNCAGGYCDACKQEAIANALRDFQHCAKVGLIPVHDGRGYHAGFDLEDVEKALGDKFAAFHGSLTEDFVCGHRVHEDNHPEERLRGTAAHCCWAKDLEAFLQGGK